MKFEAWASKQLGDVLTLTKGVSYSSADLTGDGLLIGLKAILPGGGFRLDGPKPFRGKHRPDQTLEPGNLVMALTDITQDGSVLGSPAIVPDLAAAPLVASLDIAKVNVDSSAHQLFIYYLLRAPSFRKWAAGHASGTTIRRIKTADVQERVTKLPPLDEQVRIADVLAAFDEKIENNRRLAMTLEEIAAALFKAKFVDFVGHDDLVESEIGQIPLGWSVAPLDDLGGVHRELIKGESDLPYIGLDNMPRGSTVLATWNTTGAPAGQSATFTTGDILFGKLRPYFRKVGVAPIDGRCSTEILVLRPEDPSYYGFLLGHVSSQGFIDHCVAVSRGTRMPRAEWTDAAAYEVAVPPRDAAMQFSDLTTKLYGLIHALVHEARTLAAIRDQLLPRLISGQIRVSKDGHLP